MYAQWHTAWATVAIRRRGRCDETEMTGLAMIVEPASEAARPRIAGVRLEDRLFMKGVPGAAPLLRTIE